MKGDYIMLVTFNNGTQIITSNVIFNTNETSILQFKSIDDVISMPKEEPNFGLAGARFLLEPVIKRDRVATARPALYLHVNNEDIDSICADHGCPSCVD